MNTEALPATARHGRTKAPLLAGVLHEVSAKELPPRIIRFYLTLETWGIAAVRDRPTHVTLAPGEVADVLDAMPQARLSPQEIEHLQQTVKLLRKRD